LKMSSTARRGQAEKQTAKPATPNKPAAVNVPPRQVKRAPPVTPSAQTTAKPLTPIEQRPKQQLATQLPSTALDGFSGFVTEVEGDDRPQSGSVIQGRILKFTNPGCIWVTSDDERKLPDALELIPIDIVRIVQKWIDQMPVETIIVPPGEKFPDIKAMNEEAPKSEWREYNGEMVGPWQMLYLVYLLNAHTLDKFTYPTSTIGGGIACRELADKVAWMRKHRGPNVNAVVKLADVFWKTSFGGRQRPHFQIVRWIGSDSDKALPASQPPSESGAAPQSEAPPWKEVEEPSLKEELNDDLPDDLK
jgi:hypothetical protein